jgi:hypothetical protein
MSAGRQRLPSVLDGPSLMGMKLFLPLLLCALASACAAWPPEVAVLDQLAAGLQAPALLPQDQLVVQGPGD